VKLYKKQTLREFEAAVLQCASPDFAERAAAAATFTRLQAVAADHRLVDTTLEVKLAEQHHGGPLGSSPSALSLSQRSSAHRLSPLQQQPVLASFPRHPAALTQNQQQQQQQAPPPAAVPTNETLPHQPDSEQEHQTTSHLEPPTAASLADDSGMHSGAVPVK
jgi:hypothetical protein